ncbi:peptidase, partial [Phocaeicola vulgatus]|nr:peptidase [Phocaeicola vulgatus]
MYTTYGTGYGKPGQTYHIGTRKYGYKPWCQEQEEKKASAGRKPHGFLNARIPSIAPDLYVEDDRDTTVNVTTKENLDFLYRSAKKYAQLLNTELPYHPKG